MFYKLLLTSNHNFCIRKVNLIYICFCIYTYIQWLQIFINLSIEGDGCVLHECGATDFEHYSY